MNACVIIHNMIIESGSVVLAIDDQPNNQKGPPIQINHDVYVEFAAFLHVHK
jgi:hypothetical protein